MKHQTISQLAACLVLGIMSPNSFAKTEKKVVSPNPELIKYSKLIGGTWVSKMAGEKGKHFVTLKFVWAEDKQSIIGTGEIAGEKDYSRVGWDPDLKQVYYLDCHGSQTVYFGHYEIKDGGFVVDFNCIVGKPAHFRSYASFLDDNNYTASIRYVSPEGVEQELHTVNLVRQK